MPGTTGDAGRLLATDVETWRRGAARLDEAERATNRGSWEWDVAANRAVWSKGMYRLFGVSHVSFENSNENFLALVHPDDRQRMLDAMSAALATPGPFRQEYRLYRPDGQMRYLRGEGNVLPDADGQASMMYGFVQDVTDYKKAEQELRDLKAHFLEVMAHDLNNIMTPLQLNARLLGQEMTTMGAGASKNLERMTHNIRRLGDLLSGMLDACRLQSGELVVKPARYDLAVALQAAVEDLRVQGAANGIAVEARLPSNLPVYADRIRIDQVVSNLFSNALKYAGAGGAIHVAAESDGGMAAITIRDTGAGIRPEDIGRMFKPFSRLDPAQQGRHTGTGLGLFICRGILERHGGSIHCTSPGPGKGTMFTFTIPTGGSAVRT